MIEAMLLVHLVQRSKPQFAFQCIGVTAKKTAADKMTVSKIMENFGVLQGRLSEAVV